MKKTNKKGNAMFLVLAISFYVIYVFVSQQIKTHSLNKELNQLNDKIAKKEVESQELQKTKEIYKSDEFMEKVARDKLGYVKPGEKVFIDKSQQ